MAALIGYLGNAEQGAAIKKVLDQNQKSDNIITVYLDPVFGDDAEGIYVDNAILTFLPRRRPTNGGYCYAQLL